MYYIFYLIEVLSTQVREETRGEVLTVSSASAPIERSAASLYGQQSLLAQHGLHLGVPPPKGPVGLPGVNGGAARVDELAHLPRSLLVERASGFEEGVEPV
jgi:hypothetical protein